MAKAIDEIHAQNFRVIKFPTNNVNQQVKKMNRAILVAATAILTAGPALAEGPVNASSVEMVTTQNDTPVEWSIIYALPSEAAPGTYRIVMVDGGFAAVATTSADGSVGSVTTDYPRGRARGKTVHDAGEITDVNGGDCRFANTESRPPAGTEGLFGVDPETQKGLDEGRARMQSAISDIEKQMREQGMSEAQIQQVLQMTQGLGNVTQMPKQTKDTLTARRIGTSTVNGLPAERWALDNQAGETLHIVDMININAYPALVVVKQGVSEMLKTGKAIMGNFGGGPLMGEAASVALMSSQFKGKYPGRMTNTRTNEVIEIRKTTHNAPTSEPLTDLCHSRTDMFATM